VIGVPPATSEQTRLPLILVTSSLSTTLHSINSGTSPPQPPSPRCLGGGRRCAAFGQESAVECWPSACACVLSIRGSLCHPWRTATQCRSPIKDQVLVGPTTNVPYPIVSTIHLWKLAAIGFPDGRTRSHGSVARLTFRRGHQLIGPDAAAAAKNLHITASKTAAAWRILRCSALQETRSACFTRHQQCTGSAASATITLAFTHLDILN
jgi:hypothetical protein